MPVAPRKPQPLAIRGPLSLLGVMAGLLAAGVVVPGCSFSEAQVERLHVTLPVAMPLALCLAAAWPARHLAPKPFEPRRRWILPALAIPLGGEALFNLVAALVYQPREALQNWLAAFAVFAPLLAALVPIVLLLVAAARAAMRVRAGSLLADTARRQAWLVVLGSLGPLEALIWASQARVAPSPAYAAWALSAAAIPSIALFLAADARAARRVERALDGTRPRAPDEPVTDALPRVDLGLGDDLHIPEADDAAHPYRSSAGPAPVVVGGSDLARRFVARARARTAATLVLAVVTTAIAGRELLRAPPPPEPSPHGVGFSWGHC